MLFQRGITMSMFWKMKDNTIIFTFEILTIKTFLAMSILTELLVTHNCWSFLPYRVRSENLKMRNMTNDILSLICFLCNIYWWHTLASFFLSTWKSFSLSSKELSLHHNIAIFRHQWSSFYFLMLSSSHYHYFSVMTRFSIRVTRNDLWLN